MATLTCRSPFAAAGSLWKVSTLPPKFRQLEMICGFNKRLPPLPLRFPEKLRRGTGLLAFGTGEVALRRGLNASGLASLCRRSLSFVVSARGSLLARKLSTAESRVGRLGKNLSGDLRELDDFELLKVLSDGRRRKLFVRELGRGNVAMERTRFSLSDPSY